VSTRTYADHGVGFEFPSDWEVEVTRDDSEVTIAVQEPSGSAFVLVTADESCSDPSDVAETALDTIREEYPDLDAVAFEETIGEYDVTGHDVEFFALDIANAAIIRGFSTPERTILFFGQWTELGDNNFADTIRGMFRSIKEIED
jgi:hypothetical protein